MYQVYENNIFGGGEFRACSSAYVKTRIGGKGISSNWDSFAKDPVNTFIFTYYGYLVRLP